MASFSASLRILAAPTLWSHSDSSACFWGTGRPIMNKKMSGTTCMLETKSLQSTAYRRAESVALASLAAAIIWNSAGQASAGVFSVGGRMCDISAIPNSSMTLKLEPGETIFDDTGSESPPAVLGGMTMKNFDPSRYAGRWFEVASLKSGFAGQGQDDCHCTQGVYKFDAVNRAILVDTFCVHGSPTGYITGIRGRVQCVSDEEIAKLKFSVADKMKMIQQKCFLRFPSIPFIPKQPYDVLLTDYDNFSLVSGAKDTGFIQIYSRTPNPGPEFIEQYKSYLGTLGFDSDAIVDTPQDCPDMSLEQLAGMMSRPGMQEAMTNTFPPLELAASLVFNPLTGLFDTLKKLVQLYF